MNPPCEFKPGTGWGMCHIHEEWRKTITFFAEKNNWSMCQECWEDYWYGFDKCPDDFVPPTYARHLVFDERGVCCTLLKKHKGDCLFIPERWH